ncbi:MAG: S8 family serine peptidase [Candidatus Cloacimonetes bacterium]|nr:S8 family serine peptidase [Candidatus Cloacimonadota bacterium]MCF7813104.1 S8 family serine peptidase [Candidatus Cloacimonadota bacterium]MCF7867552.1 S8 family serine peptidase [Candidatus Cloacimonadota bacterium]MCF7883054.1 S8 family serine peptidase [Candidatus Cloacimonadota bacterium]
MRKSIIILMIFIFSTLFASETLYKSGEIMVQLNPSFPSQEQIRKLENEFSEIDLKFERLLTRRMNIWLCSFVPDRWKDEDVKISLNESKYVMISQFNHYIEQREFPDDESFDLQWNMHNTGQMNGIEDSDIDAPEAWNITNGGVTAFGDTLVIAIVDGGADLNHDDINYFKNINEIPNNNIDDDCNGYVDDYDGWNGYTHCGIIPTDSHGTHVAGIAAAIGNNNLGVTGVCWNGKIMPIAADSSVESVVVEGYGYVLEMRKLWNETAGALGAFVISTNASFGIDYGNPNQYPLWSAIYDSLGVAGVLSSAATMNAGVNIDNCGDMPTACESDYLLTVTNTMNDDTKHNSAAYGLECIDLGAPGSSIYSTNWNNDYTWKTGTSMAAPHLAGAVALMFSAAPQDWLLEYEADPTKCLEIKQFLLDGVDIIPDLENVTVSGGRLNVFNSLDLMLNPVSAQNNIPESQIHITNYPNPFNPSTTISFSVTQSSVFATIEIFNLKGQKVKTFTFPSGSLAKREGKSHPEPVEGYGTSPSYSVVWNGTDNNNKPVSSGIYFARLQAGNQIFTRKMVLMK